MKRLDRYILAAQVPYVLLALVVLSVLLLLQQLTRFADVLDESNAPLGLALNILLNLLPGLLLFTFPMSVLVGCSVGFSRLSSDSELTAASSAGVSPHRRIFASVILGLLASAFTLFVAFGLIPQSGRELRDIAIKAALEKAESPVTPKAFIKVGEDKVIYVREGDQTGGKWNKVFINWREKDGTTRLVTARSGWLDFTEDRTELVLQDSIINTLPPNFLRDGKPESITSERSAVLRIRDDRMGQGRRDLIEKFQKREPGMDELGWGDLVRRGREESPPELKRNAQIALQKRLSLGFAPLLFALLGSVLGASSAGRGGRANGVFLSLVVMLIYYLISLAGEQLARAGRLPVIIGVWLPYCSGLLFGILILYGRRWSFSVFSSAFFRHSKRFSETKSNAYAAVAGGSRSSFSVPSMLDYTIFKRLTYYLFLIVFALVSIFYVFTLFELTRFIIPNKIEYGIVLRYFFYLIPYTLVAVIPVSTLLGVIVTLALMSRRSEIVAWLSAGQSAYRLLLPCIFSSVLLGLMILLMGEHLLPYANRKQNALRMMIRGGSISGLENAGLKWASSPERYGTIYSFRRHVDGRFDEITIYKFDEENVHLKRIALGERATVTSDGRMALSVGLSMPLDTLGVTERTGGELIEESELSAFKQMNKKPEELNGAELDTVIRALKNQGDDPRLYSVALERRRADPFFPLIMTLVGAPLAIAFSRRSPIIPICLAILVALMFLGVSASLGEAGVRGILSPKVAGWSGVFIFGALGLMLLSRVKT